MSVMGKWWTKVRGLSRREDIERDLQEELDTHLAMEVDANVDRGMDQASARAAARRQFGNRTLIQEATREAWMFNWIETLIQDLRYALRTLRRRPGLGVTAMLVIALGTGATTAAFTLLDHVLLRPLPFPDAGRLVRLFETDFGNGYPRIETSPPNFLDWKARSTSFASMGAYMTFSINMSGHGEPQRLDGVTMDADLLPTLGISPMVGRGFTPDDLRTGAADVVLVSRGLAVSLFGDAARALGETLRLDDRPHVIVGVMPSGFAFPSSDESIWTPMRLPAVLMEMRRNPLLDVVARLRDDASMDSARADLDVVATQIGRAYPATNAGLGIAVLALRDVIPAQSRALVLAVFAASFCLLLIACTNLASLLLAQSLVRKQEMAVRVALGAGHRRILRQLLTESLVVALLGGALGSLLAVAAVPLLSRLVPSSLPIGSAPSVDLRIFTFTALLTLLTAIGFGVGPALRTSRIGDAHVLRVRTGAGGRMNRMRSILVLAEVAGTVTLLVAAGLLVKALWRVQAVDPGFRTSGVLTLRTALPMPKYEDPVSQHDFYARVLAAARLLPGVTGAAYTTALPMVFGGGIAPITAPGLEDDPTTAPRASVRFITPGFFATLRIPLQEGQDVPERVDGTAAGVVVISESLAARLWPGQHPLGRTLHVFDADRTVIGVVGNVAVRGLERTSEPQVYLPAFAVGQASFYAPQDLVVHTSGDLSGLVPALRRIVHDVDPAQPVTDPRPLEDIVRAQTASRRDQLTVLATFTGIALVLAVVGIHGLLAFTVSARTQEVGVRLALGASRHRILGMFLRQGLMLGAAGVLVAVPLAYLAARAMSALLFGVEPGDPAIYAGVVALAIVMTLGGSLRAACRAASVDPAVTIRMD